MRTRQEIKAIGKSRFKANYWQCVGAIVLVGLVIWAVALVFDGPTYMSNLRSVAAGANRVTFNYSLTDPSFPFASVTTNIPSISPLAFLLSLGGGLVVAILAGPLGIGLNNFFVNTILGNDDEIRVSTPFRSAFTGFGRKLGGYWWTVLFLFLWYLLIIPIAGAATALAVLALRLDADSPLFVLIMLAGIIVGIIPFIRKAFSYAMTTYILSDCTSVRAKDALKLSMRIMAGHRWQLFVFELSFIGWQLLSLLTFGILNLFYVSPYLNASIATWYLEAREQALRTGAITMGQLEGTEPV